ncbi:NAD(P)/FAD-dependent oxidoreductase [Paludisphaera mucosa]|uniref:NAD(P)/FAD-dependent oxidoreductase n=1 Tax=Paludisphaera mucosa TaxID=3030827 RepID=A0ABT6F808_9BACT|nr:NAD(P)/FAD-dependent oxidoreductase [Paludisphaera mucosa]MDG3003721.1 NAD(P)/FAD-dependent oxidoreductase [Paludisphaera mucosa]
MGMDSPQSPTARAGAVPHRWTRVEEPGSEAVIDAYETVIAGGGPAGLTGAYELSKNGGSCTVLEADPRLVGGISRTDEYKGYRFDIGGHRFFSKSQEVNDLWREILGDQFIKRPRLSRIFYDRKFFHYPLKPVDALWKLGLMRSARILLSYIMAQLRPIRPEKSFEDWVVNRFGRVLFETFFKSYTEKVWGMPTSTISADWAAQRIKGLSLVHAVFGALTSGLGSRKGEVIKTLIEEFHYPRLGPGQMWETARDRIRELGGAVHMDRRVVRIDHDGSAVTAVVAKDVVGRSYRYTGRHFLSTLPIRELIRAMNPAAPDEVRSASESLGYRDFLSVVLIVDRAETFPDTWIYVHEPNVKVGRIQNFKNWSPHLVPDPSKSSLGLEYFCFEGDDLWTMSDDDLLALGRREIDAMGLVAAKDVIDGCVVRMPKAYPVYDDVYQQHLAVIRDWLSKLENLELAGRNGMHKYNNQDHSMMTALLAARNILGHGSYDTWKVNTDAEYHEDGPSDDVQTPGVGRAVPRRVQSA